MRSSGHYVARDLGSGYFGISGFTTSYGTLTQSYNYAPSVGYAAAFGLFRIVAKLQQRAREARAEAHVREMERVYLKEQVVPAAGLADGILVFDPPTVFPVSLVGFVGDDQVIMRFDRGRLPRAASKHHKE